MAFLYKLLYVAGLAVCPQLSCPLFLFAKLQNKDFVGCEMLPVTLVQIVYTE